MWIEHISNVQALGFVLGVLGFAWILFRLVPAGDFTPRPEVYTREEITAYDREIPKYFLVAALALILGSTHTVIKNLPGLWDWLWRAGYGGHLFRDLSNSHIIIVGGGTVMLTAVTWYVLPRFTNRPLFSTTLAGISFWATVVGVFGFYLSWLVLGLVEGNMVVHGWDYTAAKEYLGNWHRLPTAITSGIMGIGYWTYVVNTFLTAFSARRVARKPLGYLTKFALVSAGALFVGTVQGVIQVLPDNADWIHAAGKFGQYVDPISHAHVNLVTGVMISLAAFLVFFSSRMNGRPLGRKAANWIFWTLLPGSLIFYLTFLLSGLTLGGLANGYGGIQSPALAAFIGPHLRWLISGAGALMLAGFWVYFYVIWRALDLRALGKAFRSAAPKAFWLVSSLALAVGTFQGLLQAIPATARILTVPEEVPNIHAQLNMIGGVLLALMGLVYLLLPELAGESVSLRSRRASLFGVAVGIAGYYFVTLTTGLLRFASMQNGLDNVQAAERLGWVAPAFLVLTALPMLYGFYSFGAGLWRATRAYRESWRSKIAQMPQRLNGENPALIRRFPGVVFAAVEALSGFAGFPGPGWLLAGQGMIGIPLAMIGPAIAWGVIPVLMSPYGDGPLAGLGIMPMVLYLISSASLSAAMLWLSVRRIVGDATA